MTSYKDPLMKNKIAAGTADIKSGKKNSDLGQVGAANSTKKSPVIGS